MCPTSRFPASVIATIDGVVLYPPRFGMTVGTPFSTIATHELVVPRSMPITFSIRTRLPSEANRGSGKSKAHGGPPAASDLFQHESDGIILWRQLCGPLEFTPGIQVQPRRLEHARQGDPECCIVGIEFA